MNSARLRTLLAEAPVIAVLRGLSGADAAPVGEALIAGGLRILEATMNAGDPLPAIRTLQQRFGDVALIGAGTVLTVDEVDAAADAGARLIIAPNTDELVIERARSLGLATAPGVATPSEAFAALRMGADLLKVFPAEMIPPAAVRAMRAVLPKAALVAVVGAITPQSIPGYLAAGANGFGAGSQLWKPGADVSELAARARAYIEAAHGGAA